MIQREVKEKYEKILKAFVEDMTKPENDYMLKTPLSDELIEKSLKSFGKIIQKKKVKNARNYDFVASNHKNRHSVVATCLEDNTTKQYKSLYACSKDLNINSGIIKMCCENKNNVKFGVSKKDELKYSFVYA